jgi:membrane protease YdiL (CAAX protease family)
MALHLPIYGIGFPLFLLLAGKAPRAAEQHPLGLRTFLLLVPTCFFVMYGGNIVGLILQGLKSSIIPFHAELPVAQATEAYPLLQTVLLVVAAPVMEEFVFRRCVLERLVPYGERVALPFSALLFSLFHGSINQVCYAFMLGLVFGVVYLRTRRLRYTIALHVGINTLGAVVLPALIALVAQSMPDATLAQVEVASVLSQPEIIVLLSYLALLFVLSLLGCVLFLLGVRELDLDGNSIRLRTALSSIGIIVFLVLSTGLVLFG